MNTNILDFGAKGDGLTLCTKEIPKQQARQGLLFLILRDRMKVINLNRSKR